MLLYFFFTFLQRIFFFVLILCFTLYSIVYTHSINTRTVVLWFLFPLGQIFLFRFPSFKNIFYITWSEERYGRKIYPLIYPLAQSYQTFFTHSRIFSVFSTKLGYFIGRYNCIIGYICSMNKKQKTKFGRIAKVW